MTAGTSPSGPAWEAVADSTGIGPGTRVLDVGCGSGGFSELAAARGAVVHGIDTRADRIAEARRRIPAGDFRVELMERLPWPEGTFDVVTGFNAFQYALDVELALTEACRVAAGGRVAICKYGRPGDNEFFAFLEALDPQGRRLEQLAGHDAVGRAIQRLGLVVTATGDVASTMSLPDHGALEAALSSAGARIGAPAQLLIAAAPYRQADGSYRFDNRLRYWIVRGYEGNSSAGVRATM
jgi:SAM-dependent methyltransferase